MHRVQRPAHQLRVAASASGGKVSVDPLVEDAPRVQAGDPRPAGRRRTGWPGPADARSRTGRRPRWTPRPGRHRRPRRPRRRPSRPPSPHGAEPQHLTPPAGRGSRRAAAGPCTPGSPATPPPAGWPAWPRSPARPARAAGSRRAVLHLEDHVVPEPRRPAGRSGRRRPGPGRSTGPASPAGGCRRTPASAPRRRTGPARRRAGWRRRRGRARTRTGPGWPSESAFTTYPPKSGIRCVDPAGGGGPPVPHPVVERVGGGQAAEDHRGGEADRQVDPDPVRPQHVGDRRPRRRAGRSAAAPRWRARSRCSPRSR